MTNWCFFLIHWGWEEVIELAKPPEAVLKTVVEGVETKNKQLGGKDEKKLP